MINYSKIAVIVLPKTWVFVVFLLQIKLHSQLSWHTQKYRLYSGTPRCLHQKQSKTNTKMDTMHRITYFSIPIKHGTFKIYYKSKHKTNN